MLLFATNGGVGAFGGAGKEVAPASLGCGFEQGGRGIDGEGLDGDVEHGQVVNGVAKDRIGRRYSHAPKSCGFSLVGGHVEDFGGNDAVGDANLGGQHAVFRDIECADAFGNYPFVGGADGPDLDTGCKQIGDQRGQLREDAGADELVEVLGGCRAQFLVAEAGVNLYHFTANLTFAHLAMPIGAMARVDPVAGGARNQALLKRPEHEAQASVAAPERPIAIEDGHPGIAVENQPLELRGRPFGDIYVCRCQSCLYSGRKPALLSFSFKMG